MVESNAATRPTLLSATKEALYGSGVLRAWRVHARLVKLRSPRIFKVEERDEIVDESAFSELADKTKGPQEGDGDLLGGGVA